MAFSDPEKNVEALHLKEGMIVADLGAGVGTYSIVAGKKVGGTGKVYAVEVVEELLPKIKNSARASGLNTVDVVWGDIETSHGTKLRDSAVDAAIIGNTLFQVKDRQGFFTETLRILRPEGKLLLIEWSDSFGGLGPHPRDVVTKETARGEAIKAGFSYDSEIHAGDHHYGMIFHKP